MADGDLPVRVLYVLSSGRSGSTLLELLLATHPGVETLGELVLLPGLARDPAARCACGLPLRACPVWSGVLAIGSPAGASAPDPFREQPDAGRTLRPALLPELLTGRVRPATQAFAERYARRVRTVTGLAARLLAPSPGEPPLVVDASKDPYRLAVLAIDATMELWVVHLVRDPRGYLTSTRRPGDGIGPSARRAARWTVQHHLAERVRRLVPARRWTTLRYEDLAARPGEVLEGLGTWLGLPPGFDPDGFRSHPTHALGGNPMRSRSDPVRLDERWRRDLPAAHARLCWAVAGPTARRYGYRWAAGRAAPGVCR